MTRPHLDSATRRSWFWIGFAALSLLGACGAWRMFPAAFSLLALDIRLDRAGAIAMERFGSGAFLLNALGEERDDAIKAAFGPNYARLAALKQKYDPTNFFRLNHNVRPAE